MDETITDIPTEVAESFQRGLDALNEQDPPKYAPLPFQANFRHACMKARQAQHTGRGVSTAIDLKERYVTHWDQREDGTLFPVENEDDAEYAVLYREGRCK